MGQSVGCGVGEGEARALLVREAEEEAVLVGVGAALLEAAGEGITKPAMPDVSSGCALLVKPRAGGSKQEEAGALGLAHSTRYRPSWISGAVVTTGAPWQVVFNLKVSV
jgi:hypothetical protein